MRNNPNKDHEQRHTILIVDDNTTNLKVIASYLNELGFRVLMARHGERGLQRAKQALPDIILLDVMMPDIDGFEVCRLLKEDELTKDIPVVFMTALASTEHKVKGFSIGAVDYVTKPIQHEEFSARIKTHLALRSLQQSLQEKNAQLEQEISERKRAEESLIVAQKEITALNTRLKSENLRLEAEIDVARQIQTMLLPTESELRQIEDLEIAGFMKPADEVGGDYYDVLQQHGRVKIGIGDVTGHGLESGVVMLMAQAIVRTLFTINETDATKFISVLNRIIYDNVQRMNNQRNLTLTLLDYYEEKLRLSGKHEDVIVVRQGGKIELIDTSDLGFPIGMIDHIAEFVGELTIKLQSGDGVVLYTDGITEAENEQGHYYGLERLCNVVSQNWDKSSELIKDIVVDNVLQYIGNQKVYDDLTLLVIKQK